MTALLLALLLGAPDAGVETKLRVEGDLVTAGSFGVKELMELMPSPIEWTDKKGKHTGRGVRLDAVLLEAGFNEGPMGPTVDPKVKHQGLRAAVIATASDGFEAVFSMGELLAHLGATTAWLVFELEGKPLPPEVGPFRLVIPTDKGASRSLHQLVKVRVLDLRGR